MKCFLLPQKRFTTSRSCESQLRKHIASLMFGCTIRTELRLCPFFMSLSVIIIFGYKRPDDLTFLPFRLIPPRNPRTQAYLELIILFPKCAIFIRHYFILFKNTIMNSRTFTEKLCSLDSIKLNYQNLSAGTDKPLITK